MKLEQVHQVLSPVSRELCRRSRREIMEILNMKTRSCHPGDAKQDLEGSPKTETELEMVR